LIGRASTNTSTVGAAPSRQTSSSTRRSSNRLTRGSNSEFSIAKANAILDKAGWKLGADGIRAKDGKQLKYLYQTSTNGPRQKTQQIVKQSLKKAGIEVELKSTISSVFFSSDVANPDTYPHFYADLQMYTTGPTLPDPALWLQLFLSTECAQKANKWQGRNICRWQNAEFNSVYKQASAELNPVKRAAFIIKLNDLVIENVVAIPVVTRPSVAAVGAKLQAELSGFDSYIWDLANFYMEG